MKSKHLIWILSLLFFSCKKETIAPIIELPDNIYVLEPVENIVDSLKIILPESRNAFLKAPYLFSDTIQKNIVLVKDSKVYVTFIDTATSNRNSLCWYSYNKSQPPLNPIDIKGNLLFPNISRKGSGGLLEPGNTVQLSTGNFTTGTVIGFF